MAEMCQPDQIYWCDGSEENELKEMVEAIAAVELDREKRVLPFPR